MVKWENPSSEEVKKLSKNTRKVLGVIISQWPTNPLEVAMALGDNGKTKTLSAKYLYHFKKLERMGLLRLKRIGNTYIAWPIEIERLRVIQELLRGV